MATFQIADLFKAVGLAAGDKNVQATGALLKIQSTVNQAAEKLGAKIGAYTGGSLFGSLAKGAQKSSAAATDSFVAENTGGTSLTDFKGYGAALVAIIAIYYLFFRKS